MPILDFASDPAKVHGPCFGKMRPKSMPETSQTLTLHWKDRIAAIEKSETGFARFLANAVKSADEHDLGQYRPETLEALFRQTYSHIGERKPGQPDIRLWSSPDTALEDVTIIDIYSADTPFIVD